MYAAGKIGLLQGKTGSPLFLLFTEKPGEPRYRVLTGVEEILEEVAHASDFNEKRAWQCLVPFFDAGGEYAQVLLQPVKNFGPAEFLGADRGLTRRTGFHAYKNFTESADLVSIPQAGWLSGQEHTQFYRTALDQLSAPCFLLVDPPKNGEVAVHQLRSENGALYFPWLAAQGDCVPPSPFVAGQIQRQDRDFGIGWPPANRPIVSPWRPLQTITPESFPLYLDRGINLIRSFGPRELRLWGARTLWGSEDAERRFVSTRRASTALQSAIHRLCEPFVMEPFTDDLPRAVEIALQSAMPALRGVFHPETKNPFQVFASLRNEMLFVEIRYALPFAIENLSLSLEIAA